MDRELRAGNALVEGFASRRLGFGLDDWKTLSVRSGNGRSGWIKEWTAGNWFHGSLWGLGFGLAVLGLRFWLLHACIPFVYM